MADRDGSLLRITGLSKTFPGTRALTDVELEIDADEVHALVGVNGSGKSTLIKILAGVHRPDPGAEAWFDGRPMEIGAADESSLRFVHQDLGLILDLSAIDNLALMRGYARNRFGLISWREQARRAKAALSRFGVDMDLRGPLAQATPVERTMVAIAAALQEWEGGRGVLVLDEPTAVLPASGVERLFGMIAEVRRAGTSVLYVSHRLDEVFEIADRVSVIRGGRIVAVREVASLDTRELAALIVGSEVESVPKPSAAAAEQRPVVIEVRGASGRRLGGVDLTLHSGEILGLTGLIGSGCQELAYAIAGASREPVGGEILIPDESDAWRPLDVLVPQQFPLVPADRGTEGLIDQFDVRENVTLPLLGRVAARGLLRRGNEVPTVQDWITRLSISPPDPGAPIRSLSGGNQQKTLMARCLALDPRVLVLCEPTAGVDIGARMLIYQQIVDRAREGLSVIVSSSDIDDILEICTRVLVLRDGIVVDQLSGVGIDGATITHAMEGAPIDGSRAPVTPLAEANLESTEHP